MNAKQRGTAALAAACLLGAAAPAAVGQNGSQHPAIRVGQTVNARLAESDPSQSQRGHFKVYRFTAEQDQRLIVTMRSTELDSYLTVGRMVGGILDPMREDDDRGGERDARVRFRAPATGTYLIVAQGLTETDLGAFSLTLEAAPDPTTAVPQRVQVGQTVQGSLEPTDAVLEEDESYYDLWTVSGRRGQRLEITMSTGDFDAYLAFGRMADGELNVSETDDDSGGGTDARIRVTLPDDGEYTIRANSLGSAATGAYTLSVTERARSMAVATPRPIRAGQTVEGRLEESDAVLDDDSFYDYWTYEGQQGETLRISMTSDDFDTFLAVGQLGGEGFMELASNDDGEDGTNSFIDITLPAAGRYYIRANSFGADATGAYRLRVESSRSR